MSARPPVGKSDVEADTAFESTEAIAERVLATCSERRTP